MSKVNEMLRLVVWGNFREARWDHADLIEHGATFVSRCQIPDFGLYRVLGLPVAAPSMSSKLDAELYAVTPECLWWVDDNFGQGFDRLNVLAHMFSRHAQREPHFERTITGMQCAWMHFFCCPVPKGAPKLGYIYDLPNENYYKIASGGHGI